MNITFLGTGTSYGIPIVGCNCKTCKSKNPKNNRFRSSIFIQLPDVSLIIDTPPEFRLQLLQNNISDTDAILFTHSHADHLMGFDDIRAFNKLHNKTIPCYGNSKTIDRIKKAFNYIFNCDQIGGGIPEVSLKVINSKFKINQTDIIPLPVKHGQLDIFGYKINKMAYITDCSSIPDSTLNLIKDINVLIIDALRYKPHSTHMNIREAVNLIQTLDVNQAYLTHLSHDIEHEQTNSELPDNIQLAYDGLKIYL